MEVIDVLAKGRVVEKILLSFTHRMTLTYDMQDLAQMIYLALLEYDAPTIEGMYARHEHEHFIVGIIKKQLRSKKSAYWYDIIKPSLHADLSPNESGPDC